jgi:hypothetical protein
MYSCQVIDGDVEDTEKMSGRFEDWLRNELTDLHMHAACSVPNDFPKDVVWNWEVSFLVYFFWTFS